MRARSVVVFLVVTGALGCTRNDESLVISDPPAPPASLGALAIYVRGAGGSVFVGALESPLYALPPVRMNISDGLFIEESRASGTVRVMDALGEALPTTLTLQGATGPLRLTDEDGETSDTQLVAAPTATQRVFRDDRARQVFFVFPRATTPPSVQLYWHAALREDDTVSGEGTAADAAVALSALRLP